MNGIVMLVALFVVFGAGLAVIAFLAYRRVLRRAKGIERGLKMVPLLIHLPPPSDDTENSGSRPQQEVMREKVNQAQSLYDLIAGTAQSGFKSKFYGQRHIAFEIVASNGLVHYFAAVPIALVGVVEQAIVTAYPGARLEEVEDHNIFNPQGRLTATVGGELVLKHEAAYPIAMIEQMEKDPMEALINALYKLQLGDGAAVQIMLRPAREDWTKRSIKLVSKKRHGQSGIGFGVTDLAKAAVKAPEARREQEGKYEPSKLEEQMLQAVEEKTKHPGYEVLIRVLAASPSYDRSQILLRNLVTAFSLFEAPGSNGFQFIEARDIQGLVTAFIFRFFPPELTSSVLNSVELAALFHLPDAQFTASTQVERQQSKQVDGPVNMPANGLLLGYNFYRGIKKEIRLSPEDRRRHAYIVGQTGTGKSTMLENLAVQDMLAGNGFAFIDPHGDTAEKLLSMVPKERAEDVVYFNPGDMEHPLGLNIFEYSSPEQKDFLIQESINMLYKLYDPGKTGIIGPRFEHWYRNAALTLMADPHGASFIEIPKVFTDAAYLKNKFQYLNDPTVIDFWTKEMGQTSDYHKSEMLGWFVSKFGAFQSNEMMRNIIGQTHSSFNIRDIMDNKKILIVNLSKGRVGELNSQLLGMIFVIQIQAAAMSRASIPEANRTDFCLYVDEFQNFSTDSFASILSEARKYHLNLIVANQFIGQLTDEIREAVFGNIGSILSYRTGPEDAEFLVKQFEPIFDQRDLVNLPNHNAVMKLLIGGLPSQPFSITALPPLGVAHPELGLAIQQLSAAKYGTQRGVVEADIFARLQGQPSTVVPNAATTALTPPPAAAAPTPPPLQSPTVPPPPAAPMPPPAATAVPPVPTAPVTPAPSIPTPAPVSTPMPPVDAPAPAPVSSPLSSVPVPPPTAPTPPSVPSIPATSPAEDHAALLPTQSAGSTGSVPPAPPIPAATPSQPVAAPTPVTSTPAPTKPQVEDLSLSQLRQATPPPAAPIPAPPSPPSPASTAPVAPPAAPASPPLPPVPPTPPNPTPVAVSSSGIAEVVKASPAPLAPAASAKPSVQPTAAPASGSQKPALQIEARETDGRPNFSGPTPPLRIEARETDGRTDAKPAQPLVLTNPSIPVPPPQPPKAPTPTPPPVPPAPKPQPPKPAPAPQPAPPPPPAPATQPTVVLPAPPKPPQPASPPAAALPPRPTPPPPSPVPPSQPPKAPTPAASTPPMPPIAPPVPKPQPPSPLQTQPALPPASRPLPTSAAPVAPLPRPSTPPSQPASLTPPPAPKQPASAPPSRQGSNRPLVAEQSPLPKPAPVLKPAPVPQPRPEPRVAPMSPVPKPVPPIPAPTPPQPPKPQPAPMAPKPQPPAAPKPKPVAPPPPPVPTDPEAYLIPPDKMASAHIELHHHHRAAEDPFSAAAQKSMAGQPTTRKDAPKPKRPATSIHPSLDEERKVAPPHPITSNVVGGAYAAVAAPTPLTSKSLPKDLDSIVVDSAPPPLRPGQVVVPPGSVRPADTVAPAPKPPEPPQPSKPQPVQPPPATKPKPQPTSAQSAAISQHRQDRAKAAPRNSSQSVRLSDHKSNPFPAAKPASPVPAPKSQSTPLPTPPQPQPAPKPIPKPEPPKSVAPAPKPAEPPKPPKPEAPKAQSVESSALPEPKVYKPTVTPPSTTEPSAAGPIEITSLNELISGADNKDATNKDAAGNNGNTPEKPALRPGEVYVDDKGNVVQG